MNEEEAIEELKKCKDCHYHNVEDCLCEVDYQFKETVLNLIEKQKAEIEKCKSNVKAKNERLLEYAEEIEKKDKMINLMASAICDEPLPTDEYCVSRNFNCPVVGGNRECKDCLKQYFENKVKEE